MDSGAPQTTPTGNASGRRRVSFVLHLFYKYHFTNTTIIRAQASCQPSPASANRSEPVKPTPPVVRVCRTNKQRVACSASFSTSTSLLSHPQSSSDIDNYSATSARTLPSKWDEKMRSWKHWHCIISIMDCRVFGHLSIALFAIGNYLQ